MTASDKYEIAEIVRNELIKFHQQKKQARKWFTFRWKHSVTEFVYGKGPQYLATSFNHVTYYCFMVIHWNLNIRNRFYLWKTVKEGKT